MSFPDPNNFDGEIRVKHPGEVEWTSYPALGSASSRGVGVLEMGRALRAERPHRASGELAYHVLGDILQVTMHHRQQAQPGKQHQRAFGGFEYSDETQRSRQFHGRKIVAENFCRWPA